MQYLLDSYLACSKGREDEDTAAQRKGGGAGQEGSLGTSAEPTGDGAEAVLQLVIDIWAWKE